MSLINPLTKRDQNRRLIYLIPWTQWPEDHHAAEAGLELLNSTSCMSRRYDTVSIQLETVGPGNTNILVHLRFSNNHP